MNDRSSLVQLAIGIKRTVSEVVRECPIGLNGFLNTIELNIFPLGLYDDLIGMDWMEKHRAKVECYSNIVEFYDNEGKSIKIKGVSESVPIKQILNL